MKHYDPTMGDVSRHVDARVQRHSTAIERLARLGYTARGVVYILIGFLALRAAFGMGGATTDIPGAMNRIASGPFGTLLLAAIGLGFAGYALWRFVQAGVDPEGEGRDGKAMIKRMGFAISGVIYAGFAISAFKILQGTKAEASGSQTQGWTARLMDQPFGVWLVALVGLVWIGVGVAQLVQAYRAKFLEHLKMNEMRQQERVWAERSGRLGYAARSLVFGTIGVFLVQAAINHDPGRAEGLSGALQSFARWEGGPWVMGLVSLGLLAYGVFSLVEARYRRVLGR